ncbi:hypothetical protein [Clostridium sp. DL1XJH146]
MDNDIIELLNQLLEGQKIANTNAEETKTKLDKIEKKIDSIMDQTADLAEFRTDSKQ